MKKNILLTGASGNVGRFVVEKFIQEGHHVISIVAPGEKNVMGMQGNPDVYEADLTHEANTRELIKAITGKCGPLHGAIFLAGGYASGTLEETDEKLLKKMYAMNFETAFFPSQVILQHMLTQPRGGRMVFVGARPALNAAEGKNAVAYALSKSLLFTLANLINATGAAKNVLASVVVPSTIDTPANREAMPSADFTTWVSPGEIASIMSFLLSDAVTALRDPVFKMYGNA